MTPARYSPARFVAVAALSCLIFVASACTGKGSGPKDSSGPPSVAPVAGSYSYDGGFGVTATLVPKGSDWLLSVKNNTGDALGEPGIYALAATNADRIESTVTDATSIPDGARADFQVSFGKAITPEDMGLVILLFGGENFGPLAPVATD